MIENREGWSWPVGDVGAWDWVYLKERDLPQKILKYVTEFDLCINAGAHAGVYTKQYASVFNRVIAAEPEPTNFQCLTRNVPEANVAKLNCALGEFTHWCSMVPPENGVENSGGYSVGEGSSTPVLRIDDLVGNSTVGLIHLDVEGYELEVLRGAVDLLTYQDPIICLETINPAKDRQAREFIEQFGYGIAEVLPHDTIYRK